MTYLWELFRQAALVLAIVSGACIVFGLLRWVVRDPRGFGHRVSGELALFFGGLALLWAAIVGERQGWW